MSSTSFNQDIRPDQDKVCYAFGCSNKPSEKINISAGAFGTITLKLCPKCVDLFQSNEISSSRGDCQN